MNQTGVIDVPVPHILRLPVEVMNHILWRFCYHCTDGFSTKIWWDKPADLEPERFRWRDSRIGWDLGFRDLVRLSVTCRRLRVISMPFIHHTLYLHRQTKVVKEIGPEKLHPFPEDASTLWCGLLSTFLNLPSLVKNVQEAAINSPVWISRREIPLMKRFIHILGAQLPELWRDPTSPPAWGPNHGGERGWYDDEEAILRHSFLSDMLLSLLPNLKVLLLECRTGMSYGTHLRPWSRLLKLQELRISYIENDRQYRDFYMGDIAGLLQRAPNLNILECYGCRDIPRQLLPGTVRSVTLYKANIKSQDMWNLVHACPNLEVFKYSYPDPIAEGLPELIADPDELIRYLRSVKQTLQRLELELHTEPDEYEFFPSEADCETKWDMKDFTALKFIVIDEACLIPYWQDCNSTSGRLFSNFSPANIEGIRVRNTWKDIDVDLQTLLDLAHIGEFPKLRIVEVWRHWKRPVPKVTTYEEVQVLFEELTGYCNHCDEMENGEWEAGQWPSEARAEAEDDAMDMTEDHGGETQGRESKQDGDDGMDITEDDCDEMEGNERDQDRDAVRRLTTMTARMWRAD